MAIDFWDIVTVPSAEDLNATLTSNGRTTNPPPFFLSSGINISPEGFDYAPNQWDTVSINGQKLPGLCTVKAQPRIVIDKKHPGGRDGTVVTTGGYLPGPIDIECTIWTPSQWAIFLGLVPLIWTKPDKSKTGVTNKALPISSPGLDLWGINMCVIVGVSPPDPGSVPGSKVIRIRAQEWTGAKQKNVATVAAAPIVPLQQELVRNNSPASPADQGSFPTGPPPNTLGGTN